jgi:PGAP1-like protein
VAGRNHLEDLRGASRLAVEATRGVTDLVEAMHVTIAGGPDVLGRPLAKPARALTGLVYGGVRGVTQLVGAGIDAALARLAPLLGERQAAPVTAPALLAAPVLGAERDAVLGVLNGVLGDYLQETANPLAIPMRLRRGGHPLELERQALQAAIPDAGGRLLVLVHGSCMNDRWWNRGGHDHGAALARDLGMTPVYLHYNSGLHVSANGQAFAELLERLVAAWPVPIEELTILAHSMGGLVARSACHAGEAADQVWRRRLGKLVFLGTPHHGAPLERGGNWIDRLLVVSRYSAPFARLGHIRSAGVTDMRYGNVLEDHWSGRDRFAPGADPRSRLALPDGVSCFAVAATTATAPAPRLPGDGLVPVDSALGRHARRELTLAFPEAQTLIAYGMGHLDLLDHPDVYAAIKQWLT